MNCLRAGFGPRSGQMNLAVALRPRETKSGPRRVSDAWISTVAGRRDLVSAFRWP